ncbi:MAG: hypothetical protein QOE11_1913 [Solirubrobacteraceae bacterium]|nr:hypothetical protein [Solirubrobacteraceae bacterium]
MRGGPRNLRARAAFAAASLAFAAAGCGGGDRRDARVPGGTYTVDVVRAQFPASQHLGDRQTFALTVRNGGSKTIPNVTVTLHGFSQRSGSASQADARSLVWLIDQEPPGAVTAIEDTWTAGALAPGRLRTLRWHVTPVRAGAHSVRYAVAADLAGKAQARAARGGAPRGTIRVRVDARPAQARVDPRTGRVVRSSQPQAG